MGIIMVYNWKINVVRRRYVTGDLTGGKKIEGCDNYIINEGLQVRGVQKVVSDYMGLVEFPVRLVDSVLYQPKGQSRFLG